MATNVTITLPALRARLRAGASARDAVFLQRFFKTGPGEYAAGDRFLGVRVPATRRLVREFRALPLADTRKLLRSPIHEERLLALLLLVAAYDRGSAAEQETIYRLYLANTRFINNWDLVDTSAPGIVGRHLATRPRNILFQLAQSPLLWDRRIAVLATFYFIRQGEFSELRQLAERLLTDPHDLIHKAVGWMLREAGKRDETMLRKFLTQHAHQMPRTMLRYAIEKLPPAERQRWLHAPPLVGVQASACSGGGTR